MLKVWLIRLGSLTDVVLYDTKETALSALAGMPFPMIPRARLRVSTKLT
ncbi:hypothetical protein P7H15_25945 [Paenibacillus larvae]|nr:hypothetical protein [Paenibacillus larvae]MDT2295566.1 hypothetical protein [Paenibacillus larvae]